MKTLILMSAIAVAQAATYQVDCTKPEWKTLSKLSTLELKPGDQILLKSGCAWPGPLVTRGSGALNAPIVIDRYGKGAMPRIDGGGSGTDAVLLKNQQWIELRNLEVTNHGEGVATRRGVHIWLDDFGVAQHIVVSGLFVHDVNGTNKDKDNGGIIFRTSGKKTPSRFDGLRIERNIVWKVDRSAIAAQSAFYSRHIWFPSTGVVIRDNYVEDIGGDGIVPWACDGALVEHNIAKDCNRRANEYNAGIWPWSCDNTVMRLNEAMWTRSQKDGQGFDSDYNSRNTTIEFNYSHDNEGGFLLICTPEPPKSGEMLGNEGVEVRYNISRNDKTRSIHIPGPVRGIRVHDNYIETGAGETVNLVQFSDWKGYASNAEFVNNTFISNGTGRYGHEVKRSPDGNFEIGQGFGPAKDVRFRGNRYAGKHVDRPEDAEAKNDAKPVKFNWTGPAFHPSKPEGFADYLRQHRAWMLGMMKAAFPGASPAPQP
ncbi:MAG TPA: right-handed parallel beta-helix repeat-containing protein [Paludibaculum sp.]